MAKFERQMGARASELAHYLDEGIRASGLSVELVDTAAHRIGNIRCYLSVYDKYYMRNSSRASLSVMVAGGEDDSECTVTAISAGGGNGTVFSFSWGAEEDFVSVVEKLLEDYQPADE